MTGRNEPCPCGSGKKYKKCCLERKETTNPNSPYAKCVYRLAYAYHPRKESWVHQALEQSPQFERVDPEVYLYPDGKTAKAQLLVHGGALFVYMFEDHRRACEAALEAAAGALLEQKPSSAVNLFEHFLSYGLDAPVLPGMFSLGQVFPQLYEEKDDLEYALLRALAETALGFRSSDPSGPSDTDLPSIADVLDDYLDERAEIVGQATLRRDERTLSMLETYLVLSNAEGSDFPDPEEYLAQTPYGEILFALPEFDQFLDRTPMVRSRSQAEGARTSIRVFLNWMVECGLIIRHAPGEIEERQAEVESHRGPSGGSETYRFRLVLDDSDPPVWRELVVPGRYRLKQLHKMIQVLFGWKDYHLHDFAFGVRRFTDLETVDPDFDLGEEDERIPLTEALGHHRRFRYRYDYGDRWAVVATLLEVIPGDSEAPECTDGELAGPPEDCGGIPGFYELNAILTDPGHPEHAQMKTWAPRGYHPSKFNAASVNKKLARLFGRKPPRPKRRR